MMNPRIAIAVAALVALGLLSVAFAAVRVRIVYDNHEHAEIDIEPAVPPRAPREPEVRQRELERPPTVNEPDLSGTWTSLTAGTSFFLEDDGETITIYDTGSPRRRLGIVKRAGRTLRGSFYSASTETPGDLDLELSRDGARLEGNFVGYKPNESGKVSWRRGR